MAEPIPAPSKAANSADRRRTLRELYHGTSARAQRFRYGILALDMLTMAFIIVTSFVPRNWFISAADVAVGIFVLLDFSVRLWISNRPGRHLLHWSTLIDLITIVSFLAPLGSEGAGFLRVLRTLRLLHAYQTLSRLRADSPWFRRHEDVILAATHLLVFVFIMTGIVYETQHRNNPHIANYVDALYFTVTALTTTGFGDITLAGSSGRLISVVIMLCGVTLFLRLAQVLFRPTKVRHPCQVCGLQRHELDAVHCKACGALLNIPDDND